MEKAVSLLLHEALKAENTRSILRPIKLYRSVGLQVDTGKAPSKLAQQKAIAPKQNLVTRSCQTNSTPVCQAETQTDISQYPKPPAKNGTTRSKIGEIKSSVINNMGWITSSICFNDSF